MAEIEDPLKEPNGTNQLIILSKPQNWKRVMEGQKKKSFFPSSGYPTQSIFRSHITETEWNRLNDEFLQIWNETKASRIHVLAKVLFLFPGVYLCCIPTWWVYNLAEKRESAMQELVAKVNKYIFRPRNMYMKEITRMVKIPAPTSQYLEVAWYEIALTPQEIARLEQKLTFPTDHDNYIYRWRDPSNLYVDEHSVKHDLQFESRWATRTC